jgi:predicted component of type VI protein secretion system
MPAQLVALNEGPSILLDKPILLLGRHPECDIQIDSRKISRRHCCIAQVNNFLVVRDLGSTNGIRINGAKVNEGRLTAGDELTIGNHRYRVSWETLPGKGRPKDTVKSQSGPGEVPDDLLESCDEPVPLSEPGARGSPAAPTPRAQVPPSPPVPNPPRPPSEESFILPDQIDLLPNSEIFPNLPNPSGSHPAP